MPKYARILIVPVMLLFTFCVKAQNTDSLACCVKVPADSGIIINTLTKAYADVDKDRAETRRIALLAIDVSRKIAFKKGEAIAYGLMGRLYRRLANYDEAIIVYLRALAIYEELGLYRNIASVSNDIAIIHMNMGDYRKALHYQSIARNALGKGAHIPYGLTNVENLSGSAYYELGLLDSAFYCFSTALRYAREEQDSIGIGISLDNVSRIFSARKENAKALRYIRQSNMYRTGGDQQSLAFGRISEANVLIDMGRYNEAYVAAKQAGEIARALDDIEIRSGVSNVLYHYYKGTGQHKAALRHLEEVVAMKDSIRSTETANKIAELDAGYRFDKTEKENELLRIDNSLKETNLLNARLQQRFMLVVLVFLLVIAIIVVIGFVSKTRSNNILSKMNEEKNNIMSVLSHDLKTPLVKIHTTMDMISDEPLTERQKDYISLTREVAGDSSDMVQNLLDVTYIEEHVPDIHITEIDLFEMLEMIVQQYGPQASRKRISLHLDVDMESLLVHTDRQKLRRILDNLVANAIKYTGPDKRIFITAADDGDFFRVTVRDEGQGIDQEDQDKLFTRYSRLKSLPTGGESSTGIGLYIVKYLCRLLSGDVWCISDSGKGSTFTIRLPRFKNRQS